MSTYIHLVCHMHKRHVAFWRRSGGGDAPIPYAKRENEVVGDFIRDHLARPMSVEDEHFFDVHGEYFDVLGPWPEPEQTIGGEPCTVSKSLPSSSGSRCSTSSGGSGSSEQAGQGDGAPCSDPALSPSEQAIVDQHRAFLLSISPELWRQYP